MPTHRTDTVATALAISLMMVGCARQLKVAAPTEFEAILAPVNPRWMVDGDALRNGVRALFVVVDQDGVYFGDHRTEFAYANAVLAELARREGARWIICEVTVSAKFGEAARFYNSIDQEKYYVFPLATNAQPPGHRRELIRDYKYVNGWWAIQRAGGTAK